MGERKYFKAINFDLDTKILKEVHPSGQYTKAYSDLKKFFTLRDFSHRQGSGYLSDNKLDTSEIFDLIEELSPSLPWIKVSTKKFDVTNVGKEFDLLSRIRDNGISTEIEE